MSSDDRFDDRLDDRFDALTGIGPADPPTIPDLQRRQRRRRRRHLAGSAVVVVVVVLAVGAAIVAARGSKESGLSTVGQPTQSTQPTTTTNSGPIPVVTAAQLNADYVPPGYQPVRSAVGGSSIAIIGVDRNGTRPTQDQGRPGGPRALYSLVYLDAATLGTSIPPPQPITLMANASTEADYPAGWMASFDSSRDWEHPVVEGRRLDLTQSSEGSEQWSAYFTEQGVVLMVTGQHLSRAEFLHFVGGLRVEVTG